MWIPYERIAKAHRADGPAMRCLIYRPCAYMAAITKRGVGARKDARRLRRVLRRT